METLKPTNRLYFGKNSGLTLAEIYQYQPSYIEWLIVNVGDFKISISEFEKLPNPTPINYVATNFAPQKKSIEFNIDNLSELLTNSDLLNQYKSVDIDFIKKEIESGVGPQVLENFQFPKFIIDLNNQK